MSEAQFNKSAELIRALPAHGAIKPTTADQLDFYKYFKQGTVGDNTTDKPGMFDFQGKAKWEAWTSVKGTSKEESWQRYVAKFLEILNAVGDEESKNIIAEIEAAT